jgi:hypothetical protein
MDYKWEHPPVLCLQEEDTTEHLLIQCVHAREVWFKSKEALWLQFEVPGRNNCLQDLWLMERAKFGWKDCKWFDGMRGLQDLWLMSLMSRWRPCQPMPMKGAALQWPAAPWTHLFIVGERGSAWLPPRRNRLNSLSRFGR